jgi:hypothetical protein
MSNYNVSGVGSVDFTAVEESWSEPATSSVTVRGFPGGNAIAISLGGQREVKRTVSCVFPTRGQYVAFAILRGKVGTLTVDNWDSVGAVLVESDSQPPRSDGQVMARAQFILT